MTASLTPNSLQIRGGSLAVRASGLGTAALLVLVGVALLSGFLPTGMGAWVAGGVGISALLGVVGTTLQCRYATLPGDHDSAAQRYFMGVVVNFALLFLGVIGCMIVLFLLEVKFDARLAFGVAFAAAATLYQILSSLVIGAALRARASAISEKKEI